MADKRIQQYPEKTSPSSSDYLLLADNQDVDVNGFLKYKKIKISSLDNIVITNAEDILIADILDLITNNNLVIGRFYRITDSTSGVNPILVQAVALNILSDIGISSTNGVVYNYDVTTDTVSVPYAGVYVPYTGATSDVNLGEYQIKAGQVELDQTPTGTFGVGKMRWNDTDGTAEIMLKGGNVTLQVGQEQLARVVNKTNTNLTEIGYQVVRISGAQGQRLKVGLAQANSSSTCKDTLGLVTEDIANNAEGFITTSGQVRGINTTGSLQGETWADGDRLYLSPSVAGGITNIEPSAPNIVIVLGYVVYAHANQGSIYVSVEGAKALHELFDVSIPTPTNNNVLVYESSTGLWKDKSISTILGYTPIANNATVGGELSGTLPNPSLVTSAVTGKPLTGLSVSGSAVVSTDSILIGIGKLQNQINAVVGSVNFQGVWNASTNTPTLASGVGTKGYYYIVTVAGSTNLDGITDWKLGDWAIYDGTAWQKVDNTDAVVSVNGYTGIVTLAAADVGALPTSAISGTTGKLAKFTSSGAVGDSIVSESGSTIRVQSTQASIELRSSGTASPYLDFYTSSSSLAATMYALDAGGLVIGIPSAEKLKLTSTELITFGATDTGEAHIFGGSVRANGSLVVANTGANYSAINTGAFSNFGLPAVTNVNLAIGVSGAGSLGSIIQSRDNVSPWYLSLNPFGGKIITANATDTGEHFIIGGSARVNGTLFVTQPITADELVIGVTSAFLTSTSNAQIGWAGGFTGYTNGTLILQSRSNAETPIIFATGTTPTERMKIASSQITTFGATGSEAHIFGGSARVNGNMDIRSSNTFFGSQQGYVYILEDQINSYYSTNAEATLNINYFGYNQGATQFRNFRVFDGKTNPLFYIQGSTGNVGIGTTSPVYKTQIVSDGNALLQLNGKNTTGALDTGFTISADDSKNIYLYQRENAFLDIGTNNGSAMRIASSRNVLIGTTTDDGVNKLQVSGSAKATNFIANTSNGLFFNAFSGGSQWQIGSDASVGSGMYLYNSGGSYAMKLSSTGAATFSSSVSMSTFGKITSVTPYLELADTNWGASSFVQTGVNAGATAGGDYFNIYNPSGKGFSYVRGGTIDFQISTTGVATFSSSVTANGQITATTSTNGDFALFNTNTSSGTGAFATIYASNDGTGAGAVALSAVGTGNTTGGLFVQDGGVLASGTNLSGGLSIATRAAASMRFYTDSTLALTIASNQAATFSSSIAIGNTVTASVATPSTHKVEMVIGGVTYYLLATT